jgi:N-acetyl-anhydromuramyl-L-alanine amidase AmpD
VNRRLIPSIVAAVLIAVAVAIAISISSDDNSNTTTETTVKTVPATTPQGDFGTRLNAPTPPAVIQKDKQQPLVKPRPAAGAQIYSCHQAFGGHLWSSRNGVRPTEFVVHYTAGNGTPESIDSFFRRERGSASSTYLLALNGHCLQEVPESEKPWTQLAANPTSISVEIVTTGYNVSRAQWLAAPIFSKGILAALMRDSMRRHGIPLRHVDPAGCNFVPGWTDHNGLECGNNHTDVRPNFPYDVLQRQLVDSGAVPHPPSKHAVKLCGELNHYRREIKAKHISGENRRRAAAIKKTLIKHHYHCGAHGRRSVIVRTK